MEDRPLFDMDEQPQQATPKKRGRAFGHPVSQETRERMSAARKGKPMPNNPTKFKPGQRPSQATEFKPGQITHNLLGEDHTRIDYTTGYRIIREPGAKNNRLRREHTVIAERVLNRMLQPGEEVHHVDGCKTNNANSNLLICTSAYHRYIELAMGFLYKREVFGGLTHEEALQELRSGFASIGRYDLSIRNTAGRKKNVCPACGNTFITGGRGNPQHGTVFCSNRECRHRARIRTATPCLPLSNTDRAYAAGLIDTMGTFTLTKNSTDSISLKLSIEIPKHREPIRQWLKDHTGLGKDGKSKSWQIYSGSVMSLIDQILPLLTIKRPQAELALETQKRLSDPAIKADRSWVPDYIERMHSLNHRGTKDSPQLSLTATP
jgi:hypothetical protein